MFPTVAGLLASDRSLRTDFSDRFRPVDGVNQPIRAPDPEWSLVVRFGNMDRATLPPRDIAGRTVGLGRHDWRQPTV
jgi:hypothetical protein